MKNILTLLTLIISLYSSAQNELNIEQINKEYQSTLTQISQLTEKVVSSLSEPGVLDTTKVFYQNDQVKYIKYHRYTKGLTSVDDHYIQELFYIDGILCMVKSTKQIDYFDKGFTQESKTKVKERLTYLDTKGECLKFFEEREAIGTRSTVMQELEKTPLKEKDCMYCSYDGKEGEKYLQKLKQ